MSAQLWRLLPKGLLAQHAHATPPLLTLQHHKTQLVTIIDSQLLPCLPVFFLPVSACRQWFKRPLPAEALQYAADDVRFLLPITHSLLQTLPGALMQLSSTNILLGQPQPQPAAPLPWQLHSALLPGYSPFLKPGLAAGGSSAHSGTAVGAAGALAGQGLSGMTGICFELKLDDSVPGWLIPSYQLYMNEQQDEGSSADAAASGSSETSSPGEAYSSGEASSSAAADTDEAVESMMQLLPEE